jgi:hypothetical protein
MNNEEARQRCTKVLFAQSGPTTKNKSYYQGTNGIAWMSREVAEEVSRYGNLNLNYCRVCVDERIQRIGEVLWFNTTSGRAEEVFAVWEQQDMTSKFLLVATEALTVGRSYFSVGTDDNGALNVRPESSEEIAVIRDPQTGRDVAQYKRWIELDGTVRGLLFHNGEQIEYQARGKVSTDTVLSGTLNYAIADDMVEVSRTPFPLGFPFVGLYNRATLTNPDGESELTDLIPLADMVNKFTLDQIVSSSYSAFPRRWMTGLFPNSTSSTQQQAKEGNVAIKEHWQNASQSKIWAAPSPETRFGQFPEASLEGYRNAILLTLAQISAIGAIPPSFIASLGINPQSAEAVWAQEGRSVAKAIAIQRQWSQAVEDLARLMLTVVDGFRDPALADLEAVWTPAKSKSLPEVADSVSKLYGAGVISREAALAECGYSPQEISEITSTGGPYVIS